MNYSENHTDEAARCNSWIRAAIGVWRGMVPLLAVFLIYSCTPPAQKLTAGDLSIVRPGATALVVVHSRSGHTAALGLRISEMCGGDYIRLVTPEGAGDSFFSSPNRNADVAVKPRGVNLSKYRLLFLGSPIWYWHPTAFIYNFIESNDLKGKRVVLFYTFQGGLAADALDEWKARVAGRGGSVVDVIGIDRDKFKTGDALRLEIQSQVETRIKTWENKR